MAAATPEPQPIADREIHGKQKPSDPTGLETQTTGWSI